MSDNTFDVPNFGEMFYETSCPSYSLFNRTYILFTEGNKFSIMQENHHNILAVTSYSRLKGGGNMSDLELLVFLVVATGYILTLKK